MRVAGCRCLCYIRADLYALRHLPKRNTPLTTVISGDRRQNSGRVDVSESASISSGIADRYATAVFDLAKEGKELDKLEANLDDLVSRAGRAARI